MTFEQAFSKIKEKFDNADASKTSDFAIQITLTDEDCGGTFYAEVKDGKLAVEPYDYYDNNTVLNISKSAILALIAGRVSLDKAIANGEAFVQGDASKIADLKGTIKKASEKKPAAKKTAAKKAAPKKAPAKKAAPKKTSVKTAAAKKDETTSSVAKTSEPKVPAKQAVSKETAKTSTKTTK